MTRLHPSRPVIVIAYGVRGLQWLDALRRSVNRATGPTATIESLPSEIIQYWAVGIDPAQVGVAAEGIKALEEDESAEHLRQRMDIARTAELTRRFDTYEVDNVLVFERCSPFESSAAVRRAVHTNLDLCRRTRFASDGARVVFYDWLELCDTTREAAPLSATEAKEVARHFSSTLLSERRFLIDQSDATGAVLDRSSADRAFEVFARCLIQSTLTGGDEFDLLPVVSGPERDSSAMVRAISVTAYRHETPKIDALAGQVLAARLAEGAIDTGGLGAEQRALGEAVRDELRLRQAPHRLSPQDRRSIAALSLVDGVARRLKRLPQPWEDLDAAIEEERRSRPGLERTVRRPTDPGGDWLWRLLRWLREVIARRPAGQEGRTDASHAPPPEDGPRSDWQGVLERASKVRDSVEAWIMETSVAPEPRETWRPEVGGFFFVGQGAMLHHADKIASDLLMELVADAMRRLEDASGEAGPALIQAGIDDMNCERLLGPSGRPTVLKEAVAAIADDESARRWPPFSLHCGARPSPMSVIWFCDPEIGTSELFERIEIDPGGLRLSTVRHAPVPTSEQTVRVAISQEIPWTDVLSLQTSLQ